MITNSEHGTRIDEIADGIYRISTPIPPAAMPGGFTMNQFLVVDDEPLLFHTGLRQLFPLVSEAIAAVMPVDRLRWLGFSHVEADECGALNQLLAVAPQAQPLVGALAMMVSVSDLSDRPGRGLADGERVSLGQREIVWLDAPHVPHGWECGFMFEATTATLFCGDLFTQGGDTHEPITEREILGPSEAMRKAIDYYAHGKNTRQVLDRIAATEPRTLACMHGASYRGDGGALLRGLTQALCG
jgi:flavorubredoxin